MLKKFRYLLFLIALLITAIIYTMPVIYAYPTEFEAYKDMSLRAKLVSYNETNGTYTFDQFESLDGSWVDINLSTGWSPDDIVDEWALGIIPDGNDWWYWQGANGYFWTNMMPAEWDVKDMTPVYTGESAFVTNVDNPITLDYIKSKIAVVDNEDGNITHLMTITLDNYTANMNTLGTYNIIFSVTDTAGNTATLTVSVLVKDVTTPVITGTNSYNQSYTTKKDITSILGTLSCTDNYDDIAPTIKVETDNYSANYNTLGTYTILFYAEDSSLNRGTYTVTMNVIDNIAPVFTGPTTILKGQSETLTLTDILDQVTVNDVISGVLTPTVKSDSYSGNGNKVGTYTILLEAKDTAGNISTHTITITVSDDIPPVFYVDNYFITVEQSLTLTRQDIIDLLVASGQLTINSTTTIQFIQNEYEGNETTPGVYAITLTSASTDGSSEIYSVAVLVEETETGIIIEPDSNLFGSIKNFFSSIINWVKTPTTEDGAFYKGYYLIIVVVVIAAVVLFKKYSNKKPYRRKW